METVSAVARDSSSGLCWTLRLFITVLLGVCCSLSSISAQSPRTRGPANRPARQSRAQNELAQGDGAISDAAGEQSASVSSDDLSRHLPKYVHPEHPLIPPLRMAYKSRESLKEVKDYSGVFVKKELIGKAYITHTMDIKFREQPMAVYLRFQDPNEGRQVLYSSGANQGQLLVQEAGLKGGLLGTIALNPTAPLAMSENRHPITEIGISNMLKRIIQQWEAEAKFGETNVNYYPEAKLGNHPVRMIQTSHPVRRNQFNYHLTRLYLDDQTLFPVRVEQYDWPAQPGGKPVQVELYMYSGVRTNVGLTERDFDKRAYNMR